MKYLLTILLLISCKCFSQSSGYVLWNSDGTVRIPANGIAISQINSLQASLDGKANAANPSFTAPALGTPVSGNFTSGSYNWPTFNQNTTGSAATLTTTRTIWGQNFNGSANVTGDITLGASSITMTGSIGVTGSRITKAWVTDIESTNMPTVGGTSLSTIFQASGSKLTAIQALASASGFLKNDGAGNFSYDNPAGSGTVTDVSVVSANGISGSVATSTSTPAITLSLGAITPTTVNGHTFTTGSSTFTGTAGQTYTFPAVTSTLLPNTTTSGVAQSPTASSTTTITHNLGRVPTTIRIYGIGAFTNSTSATPTPFSMGVFNSSGNRCVYMTTAGTTAQASQTSTTFAVFLATTSGNTISGVIQNVTSTQFDIVWTEVGTALAQNFVWEAQ
jgi:hypothetical protein